MTSNSSRSRPRRLFVCVFCNCILRNPWFRGPSKQIFRSLNWQTLRFLESFQIVSSLIAISAFPFDLAAPYSGDIAENRIAGKEVAEAGELRLLNTLCSLAGNLFHISILLALLNLAALGREAVEDALSCYLRSVQFKSPTYSLTSVEMVPYTGPSLSFFLLAYRDYIPIDDRPKHKTVRRRRPCPRRLSIHVDYDLTLLRRQWKG